MNIITIPKKLAEKGDLVVIPRKEYEEFSRWQKTIKSFKAYNPTAAEKKMIKKAREDFKKGRYMTLDELKRTLGIRNQKHGL